MVDIVATYYALTADPKTRVNGNGAVHANGADRQRQPDDLTAYVAKAITDECDALRVMAPNSGRNDRLNQAAFALGTLVGAGALDRYDAETALRTAAAECGLDDGEIEPTLASGMDAGIAQPRDLAGVKGSKRTAPDYSHDDVDPEDAAAFDPAAEGRRQLQAAQDAHERRSKGKGSKAMSEDEDTPSERIEADVISWGYRFWLSDMDDSLWNGETRFDDIQAAQLRMFAYDAGYGEDGLLGALDPAVLALAALRRRHPLREYLAALKWDGEDHISKLTSYFTEKRDSIRYADGTTRRPLHAFLTRWLTGSVAKIHGDTSAAMGGFVLTLAGAQDAGKSHFAHWLCTLPEYFIEQGIHPDSKDCSMRRTRTWVWEVGELGGTTRRADVEALKAFLTEATVTERKPYGKFDTVKPAIASYFGTVNIDGGGFLADQTGNRRFVVIELDSIDWAYANAVDPEQVWAQAVAIWSENPKAYVLTAEERQYRDRVNEAHTEQDPIADMIDYCFEKCDGERIRTTRILEVLRTYAGLSRGSDRQQGKEIARALRKHWKIEVKKSNGARWADGLKERDWLTKEGAQKPELPTNADDDDAPGADADARAMLGELGI